MASNCAKLFNWRRHTTCPSKRKWARDIWHYNVNTWLFMVCWHNIILLMWCCWMSAMHAWVACCEDQAVVYNNGCKLTRFKTNAAFKLALHDSVPVLYDTQLQVASLSAGHVLTREDHTMIVHCWGLPSNLYQYCHLCWMYVWWWTHYRRIVTRICTCIHWLWLLGLLKGSSTISL